MKKFVFISIRSITLIMLIPIFCNGQMHLKKANRLYDNLAFAEALPEYQKALESDSSNSEAIFRIAHCYRLTNNMQGAEKWYGKAVHLKEARPSHIIYYTEALMSNGNYADAEYWIMKYREVAGADSRTDKIVESLHNIGWLLQDSLNFVVKKLSINSENADCAPVIFNNGIVFSSSRKRGEIIQRIHEWTDLPFFTLYYSKGKGDKFSDPELFAPSITTKFNNATICFNKKGDELYITRNNITEGDIKRSDDGVIKLNIYHYKKSGSKWIDESSFQYNSDQYNCAHPCLNADGNKLFFTSDMPGGFGGLDLYVCSKEGNGWGRAENLGPTINTSGNDCFPFVDDKDGLFYATNGRGGLGGHDIFYCAKSFDGYSEPENLGYPINSPGDDFGWTQNESGSSGYFSSNREGKGQNDDIYSFNRASYPLNILVVDSKTKMPLTASKVRVMESGRQKRVLTTSDDGSLYMFITPGKQYSFITEKEKYALDSTALESSSLTMASLNNLSIALRKEISNVRLEGKVYNNSADKKVIANAKVSFTDKETGKEFSTISGDDGSYKFENLTLDSRYSLEAKKKDGVSYPIEISIDDVADNRIINKDIVINSIMDVVKIENIFYDLNKYNVRPDAEKILDGLVDMMKSNPDMKIEIRSHTDCRQDDNYNMKLSERRAKSVVTYLTNHGISTSRLVAKGFGETMLINHCECEGDRKTPCSEEEQQVNRRTEFKILSLE